MSPKGNNPAESGPEAEKVAPEQHDLIHRLRKRAEIRRSIATRKSVQAGEPDRVADLLEEAADRLAALDGVRAEMLDKAKEADFWRNNCADLGKQFLADKTKDADFWRSNFYELMKQLLSERLRSTELVEAMQKDRERLKVLECRIEFILDDPECELYRNQAAEAIGYKGSFPGKREV